jgi:mannose-6-phosphate isomerase-like protein (cupin superfamily)
LRGVAFPAAAIPETEFTAVAVKQETGMTSSTVLSAFKRAPSLDISMWHKGSLLTYLADAKETGGAFSLIDAVLKPGDEPPPHVHLHEDELFYVIEGSFDVYAGDETLQVREGGCAFLPRLKPHAFIIRSPKIHLLTLFTPGGLEEVFRSKSVPAQSLDLPAEAIICSTGDLKEFAQRLADHGVRLLTPDEIDSQMPSYRSAAVR